MPNTPDALQYGYAGILLVIITTGLTAAVGLIKMWMTSQAKRVSDADEFTRKVATDALADARKINQSTVEAIAELTRATAELATLVRQWHAANGEAHRQQTQTLQGIRNDLRGGMHGSDRDGGCR